MLPSPTFVLCGMRPKSARHRRARLRQRLVRLTLVCNPARQLGRAWPLGVYQGLGATTTSTGTVVCIGDYVVGDEYCQWLYGPTDVRY